MKSPFEDSTMNMFQFFFTKYFSQETRLKLHYAIVEYHFDAPRFSQGWVALDLHRPVLVCLLVALLRKMMEER